MSIVETPTTDTQSNEEAAQGPAVETSASDGRGIRLDELPAKDYNEIRDAQEADKKENGPEFLRDDNGKPRSKSKAQRAIDRLTAKHYQTLSRAEAAERRVRELESAGNGNGLAATPVSEEGAPAIPSRESETLSPPDSQDATPSAESSERSQATPAQRAQYEREFSDAARSIPGYAEAQAKADAINVPESIVDGIRSSVPPSEIPHLIKFLTDNPDVLESLGNDADPAQSIAKIARDLKAARGNGRTAPQTQARNGNAAAQTASPEFARLQARLASHNLNVAAALKSTPDLAASVSNLQIAHHVSRAVLETDNSADVAIHLARHPETLEELNKSNAVQAAAQIGRISERLETLKNAPPKARVNPPAPIRTVGAGGSNVSVPLDEMPIKDFMKIRNKQERERKRGGY